jgi:VanZ family protein
MLALILVLALVPLPVIVATEVLSDKLIHLVVFAVLMIWFAALYPKNRAWVLFLALLAYGVLMELLQAQVPSRYAEVADLAADAVGLGLGWALVLTPLGRWPAWLDRQFGGE